eukprot:m.677190 g.677190  ORF g.677190 m.677190 type:complete len:130 (-) comp22794_c0_seq11:534-923(-)
MTNFENGVRVPFIFRSPAPTALRGVRSRVIVEAVDLYRTLADLTGVGQQYVESGVDGASRSALIVPDNASTTAAAVANESFARSQFPRCWTAIPGGLATMCINLFAHGTTCPHYHVAYSIQLKIRNSWN